MTTGTVRIGARSSNLSRRQVDDVVSMLAAAHPDLRIDIEVFTTSGDRQLDMPLPVIGGKGVFTEELEEALLNRRIDLAVHSLKDLPTIQRDGLAVGATPPRASVTDVLISRSGSRLAELPLEAVIGTSSLRRGAQLRRHRSDLRPLSIRGNVETRLRKALDPAGDYHAIVLATAGLERLDLTQVITEVLPIDMMLPAPGQGALAVQCRDETSMYELLSPIHDWSTSLATTAERAFLSGLGGGCSAPVAAFGRFAGDMLELSGRVTAVDGSEQVDVRLSIPCRSVANAEDAGRRLAEAALERDALAMLGVAS